MALLTIVTSSIRYSDHRLERTLGQKKDSRKGMEGTLYPSLGAVKSCPEGMPLVPGLVLLNSRQFNSWPCHRGGGKLRAPPSCSNSFSRHPLRNQLLWTLSKLTGWWGLSTYRSVLPS